jgi:large subunit ribosomal protein L18
MIKKDRLRRKKRIRSRFEGTGERPRVAIFRSNRSIYAQAINDESGAVIASTSQKQIDTKGTKVELAGLVGETLAEALTTKKIKGVVFDRSGYRYHGRVQAVAEGLRKKGINV